MKLTKTLTVLMLILDWGAGAQDLDVSLKAQLDEAGLKYTTTKAGNAKVVFTEADDRSQAVYLRGTTDNLDALELREIWSIAGTLDPEPDAKVLVELLSGGGSEVLGAWNLEKSDDGWLAYYSAKLPADLAATDLRSALEALARVADEKEKALFDSDDN